ncbi:MAG: MFS transporter [Clostridia bacterium]|nr:MFS transporter [Clostridia bacterium]
MIKLESREKSSKYIYLALALVYLFTMFIKTNYTASVAYIVSRGIFSKANAGTIASMFYLLYGIGQLFGGYLVDKFSPYKMITIGLICALLGNIVLAFTTDYLIVLITWSICGIGQFGIWPGICKIIATDVLPKDRNNATIVVNYADQFAGILSYLFAATVLEYFGWSAMFMSSTLSIVLTLGVWLYVSAVANVPKEEVEVKVENTKKERAHNYSFIYILFAFGMISIIILALTDAMLLNGAQVWIPTMVMESYEGISSGFSNFLSILIFVVRLVALLLLKPLIFKIKHPIYGIIVIYAISLIPLIFLQFVGKISVVLIVIMLCLHSTILKLKNVLSMKISYTFAKFGYSGTYTGIHNALAAFGIVVASYSYGVMSETLGWVAITLTWLIVTVIAIVISIYPAIKWEKYQALTESINK